ncbi:MAG TPA: MotA/TolQ/ExbB proton channel family protein [Thermodesulfovibrionales bacterium]|jgi:biopolymer transport protein ExbB|nr:MotA/TolQ/ExbB proton channel family protein [Thermodesulfovibrionales bacterium]
MEELYNSFKALQFGGVTIYPLLLLGVMALVIILDKAFVYWRYVRLSASLLKLLEKYRFAWSDLEQQMAVLVPGNYFGRFFQAILDNRANPAWWVESRAADEALLIEKALNRGLWVLETIVTAAPLLGLVGTIIGMMGSFRLIGGSGLVNPTGITAGVAQALIATTLGLIIALIALFAFNFFSYLQSRTMDEMERLGTRLVDHIRMDQEKNGTAA